MATALPDHHGRPWTVAEVMALPDDGYRHEVIEGALIMNPPPGVGHQRLSRGLSRMLEDSAPEDLEILEAVGVEISGSEMVAPDVVVVRGPVDNDATLLRAEQVLLAVEIVSPGSRKQDRVLKPAVLAEAGIPHFWRIEPQPFRGRLPGENTPVVFAHVLDGGEYHLLARAGAGQETLLPGPIPLRVDPARLLP